LCWGPSPAPHHVKGRHSSPTFRPTALVRIFGRPFVTLCYQTVVLSVCDVGVLWPNGWMRQNQTWHAGRPRPWTHCVKSHLPLPNRTQPMQFSAHICCGQMTAWIKMPLGMDVGLGSGDFVLDGDPAPLPKKGAEPPNFRPMFIVAKRLNGSRWHLTWKYASVQATLC